MLVVRGTRVLGLPGPARGPRPRPAGRAPAGDQRRAERRGLHVGQGAGRAAFAGRRCVTRSRRATGCCATPTRSWRCRGRSGTRCARPAIPAERIRLLPHGVDVERFRPASPDERRALRARLGLPEGVLAVYSGRLLRGKGLETLVDAMALAALPRERCGSSLLGLGRGPARRRAGAPAAGERARPRGERDLRRAASTNVADYLRACDMFVFPSLFEALGIALVEAAACGLPAVASRTGGIVDVIEDGRSGALVPPGRPRTRSAAALAALAADPERRAAMGREARARRRAPLRRAGRARALPRPLSRGQLAPVLTPVGTCSSCRCSPSSMTGRSSLKEK